MIVRSLTTFGCVDLRADHGSSPWRDDPSRGNKANCGPSRKKDDLAEGKTSQARLYIDPAVEEKSQAQLYVGPAVEEKSQARLSLGEAVEGDLIVAA